MTMRSIALVALVCAVLAAPQAGAAPQSNLRIQPGVGISKLRLGMTPAQVRRAMGKPQFIITRPASFGLRSLEYQFGYAEYTVRFFGSRGRLRALRVGTTLKRERTPNGLGVGTSERAILRHYPAARCQPLRTQLFGAVRIVSAPTRECTLVARSGRRTIFTTAVQERMFEVITPAEWPRRARVIEVSVAEPA